MSLNQHLYDLININEFHCDGIVYIIFLTVNAKGCLNTEFNRKKKSGRPGTVPLHTDIQKLF
jgi:hypothetical protein